MEVFFEKNVVNKNIDAHAKTNFILKICRIVCIVLIIIAVYFSIGYLDFPIESGVVAIVFTAILALLIILFPVSALLVVIKISNKINVEYDYVINGSTLKVIRITNRNKRKLIFSLPLDCISTIGVFNSDNCNRFLLNKKMKKRIFTCNKDSFSSFFYVNRDGDKQMLIFEMDVYFAFTLRKALNFTVFDDDFKRYLKLVTEAMGKNDISR